MLPVNSLQKPCGTLWQLPLMPAGAALPDGPAEGAAVVLALGSADAEDALDARGPALADEAPALADEAPASPPVPHAVSAASATHPKFRIGRAYSVSARARSPITPRGRRCMK